MNDSLKKFQRLLREIFQFDCADLDFGIYRIMNYKRDVIEKFITQDLPKAVAEELDRGALADHSQAASVEQNNVKGDKRFFLPCAKEIDWNGTKSSWASRS